MDALFKDLKMDCSQCFGLCCVALYYSVSEGFPKDKVAGEPCNHLAEDFKCCIHQQLKEKGLHGCMAYECMGAGQKVSQVTYKGMSWRENASKAKEMFEVFVVMRHLQEFLWYLTEASIRTQNQSLKNQVKLQIKEIEALSMQEPKVLFEVDIEACRIKVNGLLKRVSEEVSKSAKASKKGQGAPLTKRHEWIGADLRRKNLIGANLAGTLLIAANLSGVDLSGANLIGADLRDANLCGARLEEALYLTQFQIDAARGNMKTILPPHLERPSHWKR